MPRPQTPTFPCRLLARTCVRHRPILATCYLTTRARPTLRTSPAERRARASRHRKKEKEKRKRTRHTTKADHSTRNCPPQPPPTLHPFPSPPPPYTRGADIESRLAEALFVHTENNGLEQTNQTGPQPSWPYYPFKRKEKKNLSNKRKCVNFPENISCNSLPRPPKKLFLFGILPQKDAHGYKPCQHRPLTLSSPSFSLKAKT